MNWKGLEKVIEDEKYEPTSKEKKLTPEKAAIRDLKSRYMDVFDLESSEAIRDMSTAEYMSFLKE